jgi:hypothetical protein
MVEHIWEEQSLEQVVNVAFQPALSEEISPSRS